MRITAVIVTYNRFDMLTETVDKVLGQSTGCDALIIDNGSTDGTGSYIKERYGSDPRVIYVNTGENLGGAGGFNRGVREALDRGYDALWLMDDDCFTEEDSLSKLAEAHAALSGRYGWLSSRCLWKDGTICNMNVQRVSPYKDADMESGGLVRAEMASFVSLFLPADTVRKYGLPIKDFFIWGDDWEYTRRISIKEPCYIVNDSVVIHAMGSNTVVSIAEDTPDRLHRYAYAYRNDVYLYRREGIRGWLWIICKDLWHSFKVLIKDTKNSKKKISVIWRGFSEGVRFRPGTEDYEDEKSVR